MYKKLVIDLKNLTSNLLNDPVTVREIRCLRVNCTSVTIKFHLDNCASHLSLISGKMRGIAFIKDPDGYWIEILTNAPVKDPSS